MRESEMKFVGENIARVVKNMNDAALKQRIKQEIKELCGRFPVYRE